MAKLEMEGIELAEDEAPGSQAEVRARDTPTCILRPLCSLLMLLQSLMGRAGK